MGLTAEEFDAIVIGTGQAGKPLARALGDEGHRTAVVEKGRVGGTCIIDGCTPTKTMVASARVAHLASRSSDYGIETGQVFVRMKDVRDRQRSVVDDFSSSSRRALVEHERIELIEGTACFADDRTLEISPAESRDGDGGRRPRTITAPWVFLNVGARPRIPDIEGLPEVDYLDSSSILDLDEVPRHLAVLGGGPVGLELAQMFSRFGAAVTIIERTPRLLGREDVDVSEAIRDLMEDEGITVLTDTETRRVSHAKGTSISLDAETPEGPLELIATHLVVTVGRTPNSDLLTLERTAIPTDENGFIPVDERCRTSVDGIWALGDVTGAPPFTHIAFDDYRVVAADVLDDREPRTREGRLVPYTIYTDPELGRVGLTEAEAEDRGVGVRVAHLPMTSWARAIEMGETRGFVKCLVHDQTDRIVGVAALAVYGGEIMSVLQTAMMGDLPYTAIRDATYAHPTLAEPLENLFAGLD